MSLVLAAVVPDAIADSCDAESCVVSSLTDSRNVPAGTLTELLNIVFIESTLPITLKPFLDVGTAAASETKASSTSAEAFLSEKITTFFIKNGPSPTYFPFIFVLSNKITILQQVPMCKMSIKYAVKGFEPITFCTRVSSHYH